VITTRARRLLDARLVVLHHEPAVLVDVLGSWRVIRAYPAADETTHTATARARGGFPPGVVRRAAVDGGAS